MDSPQDYQKAELKLGDHWWRLNNLYYIKDKAGNKVKFKLNWAQQKFYNEMHYFNVILKARQLGFTTFSLIYDLDAALFNSNHSVGIIAHTKDDAEDLFTNKVKFAYDNLPDIFKEHRTATQDSAKKLVFNNGSSFTVSTSLRSGTYQKLLISEFGKVSAKFPDKAKEIKTGALNTVEIGQQITVESTAEGKSGEYFKLCERARALKNQGRVLTRLDPKFHFFAWFDNPEYALNDEETGLVVIPSDTAKYLDKFDLTPNQRAWYSAKENTMGDDMRREFPSTPEEAFEGSLEGAFYTKEMALIRKAGQITTVPYDRSYPVHTYWDLGKTRDQSSILFYQEIKNKNCFIDYEERTNITWDEYAILLKEKGYNYGQHWWPHDGKIRTVTQSEILTGKQMAERAGISPINIIPVTKSVYEDVKNYCKPLLPNCWFDESNCALLISRLDNYTRKWDKINGMWLNDALHNEASHGADGYRTFAVAKGNPKEPIAKVTEPGYHASAGF